MRKHRHTTFNMVEIALALAVIALGVISIMALFPIGLNAHRDSMTESYAADVSEQFIHQLEAMIDRPGGWAAFITDPVPTRLPTTKPAADYFAGTEAPNTNGTMFTGPAGSGTYRFLRYVDVDDDGTYDDDDILDFEAIVVVWQNQVSVPTGAGSSTLPVTTAAALNLEVSWPARLPYAQRQKSFFRKELFNR